MDASVGPACTGWQPLNPVKVLASAVEGYTHPIKRLNLRVKRRVRRFKVLTGDIKRCVGGLKCPVCRANSCARRFKDLGRRFK